ncbi:bifunctional phosphoribosyl-AMP cyclohydrolase/phosphoribosyl-ATP diphosphatase [Aliidiomarina sedimenti]|uniref:Histidine biosynthesis bifunctional protein HisIE n=1 Tax=Aliidiomarina sedimenti TaxID=1933879 RepID=A0ABY0BXL1_9GAMM|nr:bifunctional phosphoribosyl-AMP cyclohydrolase/phosphoribosyl-ATP diphosphatase HisIE [Aliidiomarina sedimenti]RUO28927.1 bifunctional phosphoribosyl-AMP cyclohydrolase/phosphoribosyl-ATP diphosphatase [Aliidiomarina sedimenti]
MQLTTDNLNSLDWQKMNDLIPCMVQDASSGRLLMQGYMNQDALAATLQSQQVTFFSRSKQRLWRKGEESGNTLQLVELVADCDNDAILALAHPQGPTCHLGTESCWVPQQQPMISELSELQRTIEQRKQQADGSQSYTAQLLESGIRRCAQKVGEEGVEVALAAVAQDDDALLNESADLMYHLMVVLSARDLSIDDVCKVLQQRKG